MKFKIVYLLFISLSAILILQSNSGGRAAAANSGNTGAPGDGSPCTQCHASSSDIQVTMDINIKDASGASVTSYIPGQTYDVSVVINNAVGSPSGYGFQMVSLFDSDDSDVGAWSNPASNVQIASANSRSYAEHNGVGANNVFDVKWTAPAVGSGAVTFYASGNGVNLNGATSGDGAAVTSVQMSEDMSQSTSDFDNEDLKTFLSPNPSSDYTYLNIEGADGGDYQVEVFNMLGQRLFSQTIVLYEEMQVIPIEVSQWTRGQYIVSLRQDDKIRSLRFVKE